MRVLSPAAASEITRAFAALVGQPVDDDRIPLAPAALTIARAEYPKLQFDPYLARLDEFGRRVRSRLPRLSEAGETIAALNHVLFTEEGFRGNREHYYDPRNSFLNEVLDRRLGIPITLSLIYMEVARRVGFPLVGVGMPGHFLLKHYTVEGREILIDCFQDGRLLSNQDCRRKLEQIYAGQVALEPQHLMAVSRRQMLTRMLNNLKAIYLSARNFRRAVMIVDMILAIYPRSPEDVKQRALLRYSLGQLRLAAEDFDDYLKMSPDASDADEIRHTALSIRRTLATYN